MTGGARSGSYCYVDDTLCCDGVSLAAIADEFGTPTFVYSELAIRNAYARIDEALSFAPHTIAYAVKANDNLGILSTLRGLGAGADIVSGGELARVLRAGFRGDQIVYSGVGKTDLELAAALDAGVRSVHLESAEEFRALAQIAAEKKLVASVSLRINPDVDPVTHPYIATGIHGTKFGLELPAARQLLPELLACSSVSLDGVACHIGSQIRDPSALADAVALTGAFAEECRTAGAPIRCMDAGGGWPIDYDRQEAPYPPMARFGQAISNGLRRAKVEDITLTVEPGRALVGKAGVLLSRVIFGKQQQRKRFVIVDAAMTELLRPALYNAHHQIDTVHDRRNAEHTLAEVVGPVCETGDFLARDRPMPPLARGDLLAIRDAGAYGAVMSSRYNARPRASEVLVRNGTAQTLRRRETHQDLWAHEVFPESAT